jgi:hypothetical protein
MHALVAEAMKKAPIAWISVDSGAAKSPGLSTSPAYPVWCLWVDNALYVVSGAGEQRAPGLAEAGGATVTARGDHGGRIVSWRANAERVMPDSEAWSDVAPHLAAKRLNSSGSNEALVERWAISAIITKLTPADDEIQDMGDGSGAAPPIESPAARRTAKPFKLHRVRKR